MNKFEEIHRNDDEKDGMRRMVIMIRMIKVIVVPVLKYSSPEMTHVVFINIPLVRSSHMAPSYLTGTRKYNSSCSPKGKYLCSCVIK